jgi:hypothetical protein
MGKALRAWLHQSDSITQRNLCKHWVIAFGKAAPTLPQTNLRQPMFLMLTDY